MTGSTTHHLSVLTEDDIRRIVREEIKSATVKVTVTFAPLLGDESRQLKMPPPPIRASVGRNEVWPDGSIGLTYVVQQQSVTRPFEERWTKDRLDQRIARVSANAGVAPPSRGNGPDQPGLAPSPELTPERRAACAQCRRGQSHE